MTTLPRQPEIYVRWLADSARKERRADALLLAGSIAINPDIIGTANAVLEALTSAFTIPPDVAEAYENWRQEYNAGVTKLHQERQARINAREIAKIRAAACTRCFATHAGEC